MNVIVAIIIFTVLGVGLFLAFAVLLLIQHHDAGEFGMPPGRLLLRIGGWFRRWSHGLQVRLTPPSERLLLLAHGHIVSQYVVHVVTSGIADAFEKDPRPAAAVAEQLNLDEATVCHMLRVLSAHGCFEAVGEADHMYRHNSVSAMLRLDHPRSLQPVMFLLAETYAAWDHLPDMMSTGKPVFCAAGDGPPFWEAGLPAIDAEGGVRTGKGMLRDSEAARYRLSEAALLADHDWASYTRIVDVSEGPGRLLAAILEANKAVTGVVWKKDPMLNSARVWWERLAAHLKERVEFSTGKEYADLRGLRTGDVLFLGSSLSTKDEPTATEILLGLRKSVGARDVSLLLADLVLEVRETDRVKLGMDAQARGLGPIRHRTRAAWAALLLAGGFNLKRIVECRGQACLIEASTVKDFVLDHEDTDDESAPPEGLDERAPTTNAA